MTVTPCRALYQFEKTFKDKQKVLSHFPRATWWNSGLAYVKAHGYFKRGHDIHRGENDTDMNIPLRRRGGSLLNTSSCIPEEH